MNQVIKLFSISFFAFLCPMTLYEGFQIFILENCDPKFGCFGSFQLVLLITAIFALISSLVLVTVTLLYKMNKTYWTVLFSSLFLGSIYNHTILKSGFFNSELSMAIAWAFISFFIYMPIAWMSKSR